jgi:hypothetical protein
MEKTFKNPKLLTEGTERFLLTWVHHFATCYANILRVYLIIFSPVAQSVERVAVEANCSFHEKSWLKNRVNSGKPALHELWRMVILSQALNSDCSGKVQRLELRLVLFG